MRKIFLVGLMMVPVVLSAQGRGVRWVRSVPHSTFRGVPRHAMTLPSFGFPYFGQFYAGSFPIVPTYPSFSYSAMMPPLIPFWANPAYSASIYAGGPVYALPKAAPADTGNQVDDLNYQVHRLTREVQRLRKGLESRQTPRTAPAPPQSEPQSSTETSTGIATVLIFRDGHRMEIMNYAVAGETLWVFDEQSSSKILLSDLDLDATRKVNQEKGVRFLPSR